MATRSHPENQTLEEMSRDKSKSALDEMDWNFDAVPDSELVACCYWEYARESAFIRDTLQEYRKKWHCPGDQFTADGPHRTVIELACDDVNSLEENKSFRRNFRMARFNAFQFHAGQPSSTNKV